MIKQALEQLSKKYRRFRVLRGLIKRYEYQYETELILEQWIIKSILDGKVERRKELTEKQAAIKEELSFINYLKSL